MVATSTPSANEPAKGLILVHTVQKQMIEVKISGRMETRFKNHLLVNRKK